MRIHARIGPPGGDEGDEGDGVKQVSVESLSLDDLTDHERATWQSQVDICLNDGDDRTEAEAVAWQGIRALRICGNSTKNAGESKGEQHV